MSYFIAVIKKIEKKSKKNRKKIERNEFCIEKNVIFANIFNQVKIFIKHLKDNQMKKLVLVLGVGVLVALGASCAKKCNCTYYEDGKKVAVYTDVETRYYEKSVCEDESEKPFQGESVVTKGKEVSIEVKCK